MNAVERPEVPNWSDPARNRALRGPLSRQKEAAERRPLGLKHLTFAGLTIPASYCRANSRGPHARGIRTFRSDPNASRRRGPQPLLRAVDVPFVGVPANVSRTGNGCRRADGGSRQHPRADHGTSKRLAKQPTAVEN